MTRSRHVGLEQSVTTAHGRSISHRRAVLEHELAAVLAEAIENSSLASVASLAFSTHRARHRRPERAMNDARDVGCLGVASSRSEAPTAPCARDSTQGGRMNETESGEFRQPPGAQEAATVRRASFVRRAATHGAPGDDRLPKPGMPGWCPRRLQ